MSSLRQAALKRLARREHSRLELENKLSALGTAEEIATVLDHLEQTGLLSDERTAAAYLSGHAAKLGTMALRYRLRTKGISEELIDASLAQAIQADSLGSEEERARELWRRKFSHPPGDAREWAKQARFLQSRGFSSDVIRRVLKTTDDA